MADIRYVDQGYVASGYVEVTLDASASLSSQASLSATALKVKQGSASLAAAFAQVTSSVKIINSSSNLSAQVSITAQALKQIPGVAQATGEFSQTAQADKILSDQPSLVAQATVTAVGSKVFSGTASLQSEFTQTTTGSRTQQADLPLIFAQFTAGHDEFGSFEPGFEPTAILDGVITITTAFTQTTSSIRIQPGTASVSANSSVSSDADITRTGISTISSSAALTADGDAVRSGVVSIGSSVTVGVTAQITAQAVGSFASAVTATVSGVRIQPGASSIQSAFTQTTAGEITATGVATFSVVTTQTVSAIKNTVSDATLTAQASVTAIPTFIGTGAEAVVGPFTMTVDATITASAQSNQTVVATVSADADSTLQFNVTMLAQATVTSDGDAVLRSGTSISSTASQTVDGTTAAIGDSTIQSQFSQTVSADRTRLSSGSFTAQFTQTVTALQTFSAASSVSAQFTQTAQAIKNVLSDATLSSVFSVDPVPQSVQLAQADLFSNQSNLTWDEMGTWEEPLQEYWAPNFVVEGELIAGGRSIPTGIFTQTTNETATFRPVITFANAITATMTAQTEANAIATPPSEFTASISAVKTTRITQELPVIGSITDAVTKFVKTGANITGAFSPTLTVTKTVDAISTESSQFTMLVDADRTAREIFALQSTATFDITVEKVQLIEADIGASFGQTTDGQRIRLALNEQYTAQFGQVITDTIEIYRPIITFESVASILSVGLGYSLDPWRMLKIDSETRINKIEQETRTYMIPSETRILKFQPGVNTRIVDQAGLIDRREG